MRSILKTALALFATLFFGLLVFTAETIADQAGYTEFIKTLVKDGAATVFDSGYGDWIWYGFVATLSGTIALWVDSFIRNYTTVSIPKTRKITKTIEGKVYSNTTIPIDGILYKNCTFKNVTFKYNGGVFGLEKNSISGLQIVSDVLEINRIVYLFHHMGFLKVPLINEEGEIPRWRTHKTRTTI